MDDLISRKAAVSRISDLLMLELKGQRIPTWNEVYNAIGDVPSVPAVLLDKLCEYLNSVIYQCIICKESPGPQCNAKRQGCWERVLKKWMEESNRDTE